jgi:hypothetical protein
MNYIVYQKRKEKERYKTKPATLYASKEGEGVFFLLPALGSFFLYVFQKFLL